MFFVWYVLLGVLLTLIAVYALRAKMRAYWVIFDYNSIILKEKSSQKSILFKDIIESNLNKKGQLVLTDKAYNKYTIPVDVEYFQEVRERIMDVSDIELNGE
jgi:hypothetical protein